MQEHNFNKIADASPGALTPPPVPPTPGVVTDDMIPTYTQYFKETSDKLHESYINGNMLAQDKGESLKHVVMLTMNIMLNDLLTHTNDGKQQQTISCTMKCVENMLELIDYESYDDRLTTQLTVKLLGLYQKLHENIKVIKI